MRERIAWILVVPLVLACGVVHVALEAMVLSAALVLVSATVLTVLSPRNGLLWALVTGGSAPVAHAVSHTFGIAVAAPPPVTADMVLSFVPAICGAVFGIFLDRHLRSRPSGSSSDSSAPPSPDHR